MMSNWYVVDLRPIKYVFQKSKKMDDKIIGLVAKLLDMASDVFANHTCNDLPDDFYDGIPESEIVELHRAYHNWNGDPEEFNPDCVGYLGDSALMAFFAGVLREER
jgi:hypothetical protein